MSNNVSGSDFTFMSLALADFAAISDRLEAKDYVSAGALLVLGLLFVYLYHRLGSLTFSKSDANSVEIVKEQVIASTSPEVESIESDKPDFTSKKVK